MPTPKRSLDDINASANEYVKQGDYQLAIDECTLGIKHTKSAVLYYLRGVSHTNLGNFASALSDSAIAIKIDPSNPDYWFNQGNIFRRLKKYTQALESFRHALILDATHVPSHLASGRIYSEKNDFRAALRKYEMALQYEPDNVLALHNRACVRYSLHQTELALSDFDRALALNPGYLPAIEGRLLILEEKGQLETVKRHGCYLLTQMPGSELAHQVLGYVYQAERNYALAYLHFCQAFYYAAKQGGQNLQSCRLSLQKFIKQLESYTAFRAAMKNLSVKDQIWLLYFILHNTSLLAQIKKLYEKSKPPQQSFEQIEMPALKACYQSLTQERVNVRRAARLIAQGTRDQTPGNVFRFFAHLSPEIGVKIAAHVGDPALPPQEAREIALTCFGKP